MFNLNSSGDLGVRKMEDIVKPIKISLSQYLRQLSDTPASARTLNTRASTYGNVLYYIRTPSWRVASSLERRKNVIDE